MKKLMRKAAEILVCALVFAFFAGCMMAMTESLLGRLVVAGVWGWTALREALGIEDRETRRLRDDCYEVRRQLSAARWELEQVRGELAREKARVCEALDRARNLPNSLWGN